MENRIKFSLFLEGWSFENGDKNFLKESAKKVLFNEYSPEMRGSIFCPECCADLFRSPKEKDFSENGRTAYFAHSRGTDTDCGLRTKKAQGKKYLTEEEALKAIQDNELVVIEGFIKNNPLLPEKESKEYDGTLVEEQNGPIADIPISRHRGQSFRLPSKFKTVRGLVNKFDENINRYFFMPSGKHAIQLLDLLTDIKSVSESDDRPKLYYGKIEKSFNAGNTPKNIRMTRIEYESQSYADFYLKLTDEKQAEKGITDNSVGRVIIMYGIVTDNGAGLCLERLGWGEFALLPEKYEGLLY